MSAIKFSGTNHLSNLFKMKKQSSPMPALFIGHGSPMNALEDNSFTRSLSALGEKINRPEAILCVSAHWMTEGTWITSMDRPKTIHDFYGFPQSLFDIQYPAPGKPELARAIHESMVSPSIQLDSQEWGLDHGTWSVLRHMYPKADIPVLQLSLDMGKPPEFHFQLGQQLKKLRENGVMILGSGNIVHNLRKLQWETGAKPYDWALEFDEWAKDKLIKRDFKSLQNDFLKTEAGRLSVPTMEHYYPLLTVLGASSTDEELKFEYEEIQNSSISMRAFSLGRV